MREISQDIGENRNVFGFFGIRVFRAYKATIQKTLSRSFVGEGFAKQLIGYGAAINHAPIRP